MNANQQGVTRIGTLRRSLFLSKNCAWNGLVREVTAKYESTQTRWSMRQKFMRL